MKALLLILASRTLVAASRNDAAGEQAEDPNAVTKVVQLLEELKSRVEADGTSDQQSYDKFACWCEKTSQRKAEAITTVRDNLQTLGNTILQLKGTVATRISEIKEKMQQIRENEEAQKTATNIRQKENAAFMAEKSELEQATKALEAAVTVLKTATASASASLLQKDVAKMKSEWASAVGELHDAVAKLPPGRQLASAKQLSALRKATHRYTPQSATIQGILSDMHLTFTENLESAVHAEGISQRNFEDLMATYQDELATLQESVAKKEQEKAEAETMLTDATQSYHDSENQMKGDIEFFDTTKTSCQSKTEDWGERKTLRSEELQGIDQALTILTSDEAKEIFSKSVKPGVGNLLQA